MFSKLQGRGSLSHIVHICVASAKEIDIQSRKESSLLGEVLDFEDIFDYDPQKIRLRPIDVAYVIKTKLGTLPPFQLLRNLSSNKLAAL